MRKALIVAMAVLMGCVMISAQTYDLGYRGLDDGQVMFYDFNGTGFGAKSKAMGGTHLAFYNESFSSFLNPATMVKAQKSLMSLDVFRSGDSFTDLRYSRKDDQATGAPIYRETEIDATHNRLTQAGAVAPFTYFDRNWWVGGGFRTFVDMHMEYSFPVSYDFGDRVIANDVERSLSRGIDVLNFALATELTGNISVGANMNLYTRGYSANYLYADSITIEQSGLDQDTILVLRDYQNSKTSGSNFDIGALVNFDIVNIGLKLSTGYSLNQDVLITNVRKDPIYGDINNESGNISRVNTKTKFPMTFAGGLAVTPIEQLTLALDFELKQYSKVEMNIDPEAVIWEDIENYDPEWEDLSQFRFGAEYIVDAGFAAIPLRAGVQNLPGLQKPYNGTIFYSEDYTDSVFDADSTIVEDEFMFGDKISTMLISFGTGLKFEKIWFDAAFQFGSSEVDQLRLYYPTVDPDDLVEFANTIKLDYSRLYFSVGMLF